MKVERLRVDLSDIELEDLEVLAQDGARGIPEFAASTGCTSTNCGNTAGTSCSVEELEDGTL